MAKILQLYNTFTRKLNQVTLNGKLVTSIGGHIDNSPPKPQRHQLLTGSFYICGPTVYSDSHLGHALTYIRADLFRRFIKTYFNVHLTTVMNITDIDDKILNKCKEEFSDPSSFSSDPTKHPFQRISDKYYKSFLNDLQNLRIQPADVYVKISENIDIIVSFIRRLEKEGHAYIGHDGDVHFDVSSVKNYEGNIDRRNSIEDSSTKIDSRDFVLWKAAKHLEPAWVYESILSDKRIAGRPGWHVQCSAISNGFFGSQLDFHFGGKDLIFPHHYNEEACSCAFNQLDTSSSIHVWCQNWLHSSHLNLKRYDFNIDGEVPKDVKMSKSLGNVVPIGHFIDRSSVNALRLLCVLSHYRSDLDYSEELIDSLKSLDHKIKAFHNFLADKINQLSVFPNEHAQWAHELDFQPTNDCNEFELMLLNTENDIVDGICDDMDLRKGLDSILRLAKYLYSTGNLDKIKSKDLIVCYSMLRDWCKTCGLEYSGYGGNPSQDDFMKSSLHDLIRKFRHQVRTLALNEIKASTKSTQTQSGTILMSQKLLHECDIIRSKLDELGFVERDPSSVDSKEKGG